MYCAHISIFFQGASDMIFYHSGILIFVHFEYFYSYFVSVITIYAGFGLAKYIVPAILAYLLIGFACYQVLVLLFMEALKSYDAKKSK